jgi:hypothetical protein
MLKNFSINFSSFVRKTLEDQRYCNNTPLTPLERGITGVTFNKSLTLL